MEPHEKTNVTDRVRDENRRRKEHEGDHKGRRAARWMNRVRRDHRPTGGHDRNYRARSYPKPLDGERRGRRRDRDSGCHDDPREQAGGAADEGNPDNAIAPCLLTLRIERKEERCRSETRENKRLAASPRDHAEYGEQKADIQAPLNPVSYTRRIRGRYNQSLFSTDVVASRTIRRLANGGRAPSHENDVRDRSDQDNQRSEIEEGNEEYHPADNTVQFPS
jgi:hypothetical protein